MEQILGKLWVEEEGQGLAEYSLIVGLIAVACVGAMTLIGTNASAMLNSIAGKLQAAP